MTYVKSRHGDIYPYFICAGRHRNGMSKKDCDMKAIPIDEVEAQVEQIYDNYSIKPEDRLLVEAYMQECISNERDKYKAELNSLVHEKNRLERRQEKLLEAHFNGAIPLDLLKKRTKGYFQAACGNTI